MRISIHLCFIRLLVHFYVAKSQKVVSLRQSRLGMSDRMINEISFIYYINDISFIILSLIPSLLCLTSTCTLLYLYQELLPS